MTPGEAQLGADMDDRYAGRYCFLKVAVICSRSSVEGKRYARDRRELADAANVEALSHAAADHTLQQPMHISTRGIQDVLCVASTKALASSLSDRRCVGEGPLSCILEPLPIE